MTDSSDDDRRCNPGERIDVVLVVGGAVARLRLRPTRAAEAARRARASSACAARPTTRTRRGSSPAPAPRTHPGHLHLRRPAVPAGAADHPGLGRARRAHGRPARHELVARSDRRGMGRAARSPAVDRHARLAVHRPPADRAVPRRERRTRPLARRRRRGRSRPPTSCTSTSIPTGRRSSRCCRRRIEATPGDSPRATGTTPIPTTS